MLKKQHGELIVTGKDKVHITLDGHPSQVKVFLAPKNEPAPCNSSYCYNDSVEWNIFGGTLNIYWNVVDYRKIVWSVELCKISWFRRLINFIIKLITG